MKRRRDSASVSCPRPSPLDELIAKDEPPDPEHVDQTDALLARLDGIMYRVPQIERELVRLAMAGKSQREMGEVTGITQASVSTRLRRAVSRLRYHARRPDVDVVAMARDLTACGYDSDDVAILVVYLETACLSEAARRLGLKYRTVRTAIEKAPARLQAHAELSKYLAAFEYVRRGGLLGRT